MRLMKIGLLIFFIGVLPYLLGMLPLSLQQNKDIESNDKNKPGIMLIAGWFLMFALFQLVAVPMIIAQLPFTYLVIVYDVVLCVALGIAFMKGRFVMANQIKSLKSMWKKREEKYRTVDKAGYIIGCIVAVGLLLLQLTATFKLEHYDGDDAYYVAASVATDLYDTMYLRDNYTGYQFTLESRHALSPTPIFVAWLTRMTGVHPTILAHSVLGLVWIGLMYLIYWQIAKRLCKDKKQYAPWFMVFLMLWFLFGNVSIYTTETFALTRIWQGKGLVTAIIIPTMFLCLLYLYEGYETHDDVKMEWFMLFCCVFTAVFATSTSIFLVPIFLGLAGLLFAVRLKQIKCFIQLCLATVPALVYGVLYMILR